MDPWWAAALCCRPRMLTPKLRAWAIACAAADSEWSETRTVGGSADTEAKALTVIPQGRPASSVVTITTPLARTLIASA